MTAPLTATAVASAIAAIAATVLWLRARLVVVTIEGVSMAPGLAPDDRVIVRRIPASRLRAGRIAVVEQPYRAGGAWVWPSTPGRIDGRTWMVKRIAAVPGDPVPARVASLPGPVVPDGYVLVLGDNADASVDSRRIGYVPVERVLGVVF